MIPLATAQAAFLATCSMSSASRSRSGPTCSWTRRATIFPHRCAMVPTPVESINDDLRKGMTCPSLDFGEYANWETRVDILPPQPGPANRDLHPPQPAVGDVP